MEEIFEKTATKVSLVSILCNSVLSLGKLFAGVFANSSAMVSDSIHSASDVFSSIVVIIGVRLSSKDSDKEHPYGHERMECVAAIILATILSATGFFIGYSALKTIATKNYKELVIPGLLALVTAILSIIVKEAMFWYTKYHAKAIDSSALMADAWHHRSDALSSVGALVGIAGARLGFPLADTLASLIICFFIEKAALEIFLDAINKMVDHACDVETEQQLKACILSEEGVEHIDLLRTRMFGSKIYVELEISVNGNISLTEAHSIAERVHSSIEERFHKVKHIMVHVNPSTPKDQ